MHRIRLAIECKNLRETFPLAVFQVPRSEKESYHDLIFSHEPYHEGSGFGGPFTETHGSMLRLRKEHSFYAPGDYVGKSCSQVGRAVSGELTGNDAEVYGKWYQAIHSAHDLIDRANEDWESNEKKACATLVLPILVVPNMRLWGIKYQSDGTRAGDPEPIDRACLYIDKFVASSDRFSGISANFSHLELLTENGLDEMCTGFLTGDLPSKAFSQEGIRNALPSAE